MTLSRRSEKGFTLLEVLVSVTLIAMMALAIWGVMRTSIRSWSRGAEFIDTNQRHRSIMDMVRKQIASAYNLPSPPDPTASAITAPYPIFSGADVSFQFISLNSLQFQESPGITLVTYEISESAQSGYSLIEKESRYLGQLPDLQTPAVAEKTISILENLTSCLFEYYDPGTGTADSTPQWVKEWDAKQLMRLPSAIRMTMTSRDHSGNTLDRQIIVPIQAASGNTRSGFVIGRSF
jgi:general secretion pathway protein J